MSVRRVAVFSMHTSPLAQPGSGDGGGMNVYVRALAGALARAGVECDVYTRAEHRAQPLPHRGLLEDRAHRRLRAGMFIAAPSRR